MDLQRIGRYDIKCMIGQGGMSTVYLGYDPRSQREVAIKILPPYYQHAAKFRERFDREALMIALLEHPAIVPVYDMGEEDGQPYIVMRYMSGGSLSDKLRRGPILLRECMEMYLRLAPALDTAHARGVTHRDVKPDNLLFDKYDNVFLSDFGLARLRETIGFANISDGSVMGTPAYMSPEQIQGDREIDGRSDIYSMGVVLYQMLCGEVPFYGTTAASVMMMHLVNPVPQIRDQNKSLPVGIQTVLDTAMAKSPDDRYQTAGELARAIQAVTTGVHKRPVIETNPSSAHRQTARHSTPSQSLGIPPFTPDSVNGTVRKPASVIRSKTPIPGEINGTDRLVISEPEATLPGRGPSGTPKGVEPRRVRKLPFWGYLVGAFVIILLSMVIILRSLNIFPFSTINNPASSQNNGIAQNSPTAQVSVTGDASSQSAPVLGQADKLAFLKSADIWASNLDGSNLIQLTADGSEKSNLKWSPDGQSVIYTSANCIKLVGLLTRQVITLTCFSGLSSIDAFDISSDGQNAAIGLAQNDLFLLPYSKLFTLGQSILPSALSSQSKCSYYAPYQVSDRLKAVHWAADDGHLAILLSKLVQGTYRDEVNVLDFSQCTSQPLLVDEITPTYFLFTFPEYYDHPEISSLSWKDSQQLLISGNMTEQGFGDLQLYNLDKNNSQEVAPNGPCCYRDVRWSPDGTYLFYAFQPESGGEISIYYAPNAELDLPDAVVASLVLPEGFLAGDLASLQPALRAVHQ
jgi:serine/threonine protein kinase